MASWHEHRRFSEDTRMPLAGVLLIAGVVCWTLAVVSVLVWVLL